MSAVAGTPDLHVDRRSFLTGLGAAAIVGSAATVGGAMPAAGSSPNTFSNAAAPKPIPFRVGPTGAPAPFDLLHWTLPGPTGAKTQILELEAFGLDVHRSTMYDYEGFTTYAVVSGTAESSEGMHDVELDIRVMDGKYIGMDGKQHRGTFGFFWFDLFAPGQGAAGQNHDFNPGILQNGLFWTMALPRDALQIRKRGTEARLRLANLPMPDTFQFANNVSVSGEIDLDLTWRATGGAESRGNGNAVPEDDPTALLGEFAAATCSGRGGGASTGFHFRTGELTEAGFYAELGYERNGVFA